jgi:tetratricopeptide (TPR) repeat protein
MPLVAFVASPPGPVSDREPASESSLETVLSAARDAEVRGAFEDALVLCKKALMFASASGPQKCSIYMRLAHVKQQQGKSREAELNYEKALEADKENREPHEALVALAEEAGDFRRVVTLRQRMRTFLDDASQFALIAGVLERNLNDASAAAETLEEARTILRSDPVILGELRRIYEKQERWRKVIDVTGELAGASVDPRQRGELRFAQADVALGRLRDEERGLAWLEAALDEDPAHDRAFVALVAVRTQRQEWAPLDRAYAGLVDRYAVSGDATRAWDICRRLGLLRRDVLGDVPGAIDAFRGALRCRADDIESRAALADLLMTTGDTADACRELQLMATLNPTRVATHRKLFDLHSRVGRADSAWLAATALEELGAADMDHQLIVEQYRAEGTQVVRPSSVFDESTWREWICAKGSDETVTAILRAIARPAAMLRVSALRAQKKLTSLRPEARQAPTSTVSIVRTFVWASRILDVPLPDLFVCEDVPGGLAAVQLDARTTAIGPEVVSGLPLQELAFVVARHLAYYRPEHYALVFYPTLPELTQLFLSAIEIGLPKMPLSSRTGADGKRFVHDLAKLLKDEEREELRRAASRFEEGGGRVDLAAWIRGVELTATRVGFVLSGDLAVAMRVLRRESRSIADLSLEEKRGELLAYSASEDLARLREQFSMAARSSGS